MGDRPMQTNLIGLPFMPGVEDPWRYIWWNMTKDSRPEWKSRLILSWMNGVRGYSGESILRMLSVSL